MSEHTSIFRTITLCIFDDFTNLGKVSPDRFDDIPSLKKIIDNRSEKQREFIIACINMLAIIPGNPQIKEENGIPKSYAKYRIFAIGRNRTFDKVSSSEGKDKEFGGRHSIIMNADGSDLSTMWIPEEMAQIILKQLKGFDPAKQALAFQDLAQGGAEEVPRQKSSNFNENSVKGERHTLPPDQSSMKGAAKEPSDSQPLWIVGGIIFLISVIGYVIRQRCRKSL